LVVLDSWALLAYLKDEPAAARIEEEWLVDPPAICSIDLGEVFYILIRDLGEDLAEEQIELVRRNSTLVEPDWDLTAAAARLKATGRLAYADAFCMATAERLKGPLLTGDPEIIDRAQELPCTVVDLRQI
jgi:PIN domain nuclease of toxin-antitoxin system